MKIETSEPTKGVDRLEALGFKTAALKVKELISKQRKLAIAYEHYRFIRQDKIDAFNAKLRAKSGKNMGDAMLMEYQKLDFMDASRYEGIPPDSVLDSLEKAKDHKCFDNYEVAYIRNVKDPLLLGRVNGCPDRFFIDQWDNDVKIEDILKTNEG